jgi:hypothetical protein
MWNQNEQTVRFWEAWMARSVVKKGERKSKERCEEREYYF